MCLSLSLGLLVDDRMARSFPDKSVFLYGRQMLSLLASQIREIAGLLKILQAQSLDILRAARIAATARLACADNDVECTWLWLDLLMIALAGRDPEGFEAKMNSFGCKYQSYFARRYYGHGKAEGQADGQANRWTEGREEMIFEMLASRFGPLTEATQARFRCAQEEREIAKDPQ